MQARLSACISDFTAEELRTSFHMIFPGLREKTVHRPVVVTHDCFLSKQTVININDLAKKTRRKRRRKRKAQRIYDYGAIITDKTLRLD
jgi:hypothetical protein